MGIPGSSTVEHQTGKLGADEERLRFVPAVLLFAMALLVLLPGFQVSLFDRDEGWYAQVCREMLQTGDWLVPRYLGEVWLAKPPLTYWLVAAIYKLLGIGEWQARLVPVLATSMNVVLIAVLGTRMFGRRVGVMAGVLFITACLPAIVGKMLLTDPVMLMCTLMVVICHWQLAGLLERKAGGEGTSRTGDTDARAIHLLAACYWLFLGLGIMAKGPATLVFAGSFALALLTMRDRRAWFGDWRYWMWLPVSLLVAAPWYAYIAHQSGGTFVKQFLGYEIAERIKGTPHGHGGPPGYYVLLSLAGLLPWTPFVPGALIIAFKRSKSDLTLRLLLIWMLLPWMVLELIHSKLPHYILPCYVPLFILLAKVLDDSLRARRVWADVPRDERVVLALWTRVLSGIGMGLFLAGVCALTRIGGRWEAPPLLGPAAIIVGLVLLGGFGLVAWAMRWKSLVSAGLIAIVSMIGFHMAVGWLLFPSLEPVRLSRNLANRINLLAAPGTRVYLCGYEEPSAFFYLRGPAKAIDGEAAAALWDGSDGPVLLAITQRELDRLPVDAAGRLKARAVLEPVHGFNYVKMSEENIRLLRLP